ncbi:MAG: sugar ABC transporter permease [Anaerolineae bacterium]|nr:sugar ABC transporter permease [Anaerolineae bacterium]
MAQQAIAPRISSTQTVSLTKRLERLLGKDWKIALVFLLPIMILIGGLILYPFLNAIYLSMTVRQNRREVFVGMANYARLLVDDEYTGAVLNTIRFTVISVGLKLVVGLAIAMLLHSKIPFRSVLSGIMLLPWIVPEVVTALTWRGIFDPIFGMLNPILMNLGLIKEPVGWLSETGLALKSVIAVNIWKGIPFYTILLLAGLKAIDKELYEAAEVDGANPRHRFLAITLPGLKYVIATTVLLSAITTFNSFGLIYLMTGGGPSGETRMYSILAYERALLQNRFGPGTAVSLLTAPLMGIFIFFLARFMRGGIEKSSEPSRIDRALAAIGQGIGAVGRVILLPVDWVLGVCDNVIDKMGKGLTKAAGRNTLLNRQQRERSGLVVRLLLLLPFLIFVVFPFFFVIVTAFKGELQISQRVNLFVPTPWTLDQFRKLLKTRNTRCGSATP